MNNQIIGTHLLRKTAFLFANWGYIFHQKNRDNLELPPMETAAILLSARHKEVSSTATYLDDSGTLHALVCRDHVNRDRHRIGRWEPIHMTAMDSFESILLESRKYQKPLPILSSCLLIMSARATPQSYQFHVSTRRPLATSLTCPLKIN